MCWYLCQVVEDASTNLLPNNLCEYLYNLSEMFTRFYTNCQVHISPFPSLNSFRENDNQALSLPFRLSSWDLTSVFVNSTGGRITGGAKPAAALRSDCHRHAPVLPPARDHTCLQAVIDQSLHHISFHPCNLVGAANIFWIDCPHLRIQSILKLCSRG